MTDDENLLTPATRRADAVKNRALLLETAKRLFEEQGVETVSMTAIADAAGVGKGTLYRHFENKIELIHALLDHRQRDLQARTFEKLASRTIPATEKLRWFLTEVIRFVSCLDVLRYLPEDLVLTLRHPAHFWWRQTISGLLCQIRPTGDIEYLTDMLYVLVDVRPVAYLIRDRGYTTERIINSTLDVLDKLLAS
jgi:AcrR family transcriptional regulator